MIQNACRHKRIYISYCEICLVLSVFPMRGDCLSVIRMTEQRKILGQISPEKQTNIYGPVLGRPSAISCACRLAKPNLGRQFVGRPSVGVHPLKIITSLSVIDYEPAAERQGWVLTKSDFR